MLSQKEAFIRLKTYHFQMVLLIRMTKSASRLKFFVRLLIHERNWINSSDVLTSNVVWMSWWLWRAITNWWERCSLTVNNMRCRCIACSSDDQEQARQRSVRFSALCFDRPVLSPKVMWLSVTEDLSSGLYGEMKSGQLDRLLKWHKGECWWLMKRIS